MRSNDIVQIASGVLRDAAGAQLGLGVGGVGYVSLYPTELSGERAEVVVIRATQNVFMAVNKPATTTAGALLAASTNYQFPVHPDVNTLSFIAVAASTIVNVSLLRTR